MAKHIRFENDGEGLYENRPVFKIVNKRTGDVIGKVGWYPHWSRYAAAFSQGSVWSDDCLTDVAEFMKGLPRD